ncbi:sortase domain-containing protein [Catenulispora rubra]|uniref:sortase domain-containing protein n=1 Tax=Catenulispora rubra TaxID=280293 RepID=UPI0018924EA8|nr:sortase [Catenulispora rubra]
MGRHSGRPGQWWAARPLATLGLLGSCGAITVGGVGLFGMLHSSASAAGESPATASAQPSTTTTVIAAPSQTSATKPVAATLPVTLQIPAITVNTALEQLGVASDGALQTPTDPRQAGWFTGSSLPGQPGPVVIAGHVDSLHGPAIFAHLKKIKAGDPITITLSNGSHVVYVATSVVDYAKAQFPSQSVYGPRPDSELRLITCGGAFVKGQYADNVVVFAKLSG